MPAAANPFGTHAFGTAPFGPAVEPAGEPPVVAAAVYLLKSITTAPMVMHGLAR